MPDHDHRPPFSPLRVTPTYTSGDAGDCHVHHGDGIVAVLVGLTNPELAGPLITRLHHDLDHDGRTAWLAASRTEPVAGAVVATVDEPGVVEIAWWGRVDVHVATSYGYETHTGDEDPRNLTVTGSNPVRVVPRAAETSSGSSLDRGTVRAAGCEIALTPQPTTPDTMPEVSRSTVEIPDAPTPTPTASPSGRPPSIPGPSTGEAVAVASPVDVSDSPDTEPPPRATVVDVVSERGIEMVRGLRCRNGHHNHPEARLCSLCGDAMQNVSIFVGRDGVLGELGERPPLGILTLDDGQAYQIGHDTVIGRSPSRDDASTMVIEFPEDDTMSRAHLAIDLDGWNVFVRDLGSSNGTGARFPDSETYLRLEPHQAYPLPTTTVLVFGRRWCTFTATSAAPVRPT